MAVEFTIQENPADGTYLIFSDVSTDVTFASILAVRLIFGNYSEFIAQETVEEDGEFEQYREYQLTSLAPVQVDSKWISTGGLFVPPISGLTAPADSTWVTTGNFVKYIAPATYLPTSVYNLFTRTPQDIGYDSDVTVIPDMIRSLTYETYIATTPTPLVTTVANTQYLVKGTTGTCVTNSSTYRPGEMFIASDAASVTLTGDCTLLVLSGIRYRYFTTAFEIKQGLSELQLSAGCEAQSELRRMWNMLKALEYSDIQNRTSATLNYSILLDLQRQIAVLQNCENTSAD